MSSKSNFAQALRELTGFDTKEEANVNNQDYDDTSVFLNETTPPSKTSAESIFEYPTPEFPTAIEGQTSITSGMKITGDIKSEDNLYIAGKVFGNISTTENVMACDLIIGDVKANHAVLKKARLKGSSVFKGNLNIEIGSVIVGDINASNIKLAGKVKGDIKTSGTAIFADEALLVGNITANELSTEAGARINGTVTVTKYQENFDEDTEFDLGGDF